MAEMDHPSDNDQGRGETPKSLHTMAASEMAIVQRAFKERWPMTPEYRQRTIDRVMEAIDCKESTQREINAAARTLALIDRLNIIDENPAQPTGGFLEGLVDSDEPITIQVIVAQLREDPHYEEFARQQMLAEAGVVVPPPHSNGKNGKNGNGKKRKPRKRKG